MAKRQTPRISALPKNVLTLREALYLLALGEQMPKQTTIIWSDDKFDAALEPLCRILRDAKVNSFGRPRRFANMLTKSEREAIPAEHWNLKDIQWWEDSLNHPSFHYEDVVVDRKKYLQVLKEFRSKFEETTDDSYRHRGRPPGRPVSRTRPRWDPPG